MSLLTSWVAKRSSAPGSIPCSPCTSPDKYFAETEDITRDGIIGNYVHGNEPAHHVAYLYNFAGQPWKTQQRVRMILKNQYKPAPDGLGGNDDCGQMSAWYLFSTLGFIL